MVGPLRGQVREEDLWLQEHNPAEDQVVDHQKPLPIQAGPLSVALDLGEGQDQMFIRERRSKNKSLLKLILNKVSSNQVSNKSHHASLEPSSLMSRSCTSEARRSNGFMI